MPSINKSIIVGHLGNDPEIRFTQSGKSVASMTVATTERYKQDGVMNEVTEWHRVTVWGGLVKQAEHMVKGDLVYVEGRLQTRSWEKDGIKRYTTEIVAKLICKMVWVKDDKPKENKTNEEDWPF